MGDTKPDPALCRKLAELVALDCVLTGLERRAVADQLIAAAELAERPTLTEERVREVVERAVADWLSMNCSPSSTLAEVQVASVVMGEGIAARAAKELAGAMASNETAKLRSALREALSCWRYPQLTAEEKARKDEIWAMVYPIGERDGLDTVFDRASLAIAGQPAAELNERLTIESRRYPGPADHFDAKDEASAIGAWEPASDDVTSPAPRETMAEVQDSGERVDVREGGGK